MNAKKRIKIVKRGERDNHEAKAAGAAKVENVTNATQTVARQVTTWIKEFQQRRIQESRQNFANLFQRA